MLALTRAEVAILLISEDLDEIFSLSDRIAVVYEGWTVGVVSAVEGEVEEMGLMCAGVKPKTDK